MSLSISSRISVPLVCALLCASSLLLVACAGNTVSKEAPGFVDSETRVGIDANSPSVNPGSAGNTPVAIKFGDKDFVTPTSDFTLNATLSLDEKKEYVGHDAVKLWVWNGRGVQGLAIPEYVGAEIKSIGVSIQVVRIDPAGEITLLVNGAKVPPLHMREEVKSGSTYVFVSDVFLNEQ